MNKSYNFDNRSSNEKDISDLSEIFDREEITDQASHFLSNLGYALKKFRYLIIFCILLFSAFGWYNTAKKPFLYRSSLTLINEPDLNIGVSSSDSARFLVYLTQHYYQTQFEILTSKKLARIVAQNIITDKIHVPEQAATHLKQSPVYVWSELAKEQLRSIANRISAMLRGSEIETEAIKAEPETLDQQKKQINRYTNLVRSGLKVSGGVKSQLLTLSFVSTDRVFAAEILNLTATVYQEFILDSKQKINQSTTGWLVEQLEAAKDELLKSEKRLVEFQREIQSTTDANYFENQNTVNINALNQEYNSARLKYDELLTRYGSKHPQVRKAYIELNSLRNSLDKTAVKNLNNSDLVFELTKFEKEVETNKELYLSYLTRFKGFNITGDQHINTVKVLDKAEVPGAPFSPNLQKGIILWCLFGALFGVILSLILSFLDRTYKTTEDIEHKLGLPVLGQLPFLSNKVLSGLISGKKQVSNPEIYYSINAKSIFSEAINHIRTNLLFSRVDKPPQTILLTSSIQSEGKTTVATNLAFSLAKIDKTILIDADLRKPRIANVFLSDISSDEPKGLVDYLAGMASFDDCSWQHSTFNDLTILPSGTIPPNPQELLASVKFNQFLEELKSQYKYVVIDTAPVLPVSDAIVLGKVVDVLLVAVKAGSTTIKMTKETIKRLNIARVYPAGLVLTQLDKPNKAYGRHGLNYYYSYYGKNAEDLD